MPIERLESRQSNHREQITSNNHSAIAQQHNIRNTSSPLMSGSYEEQHIHYQQQQHQSHHQLQQQQQQQQHHQREQLREQHSRNMHHVMGDSIDHHNQIAPGAHHYNGHGDEDDRLDEREHFNEHHQYAKQQSFLHSSRKNSAQHHAANTNSRDHHPTSHQAQQSQNLDANYMTEENNAGTTSPSVTRYSLLQFAMQHFRNE